MASLAGLLLFVASAFAQDLNSLANNIAEKAINTKLQAIPVATKCSGAACNDKSVWACDVTKGTGECVKNAMPETDIKCSSFKSCGKCVGSLHCGWCLGLGKCMEGLVGGPNVGNCTDWDYAFCSAEPCSTYGSCGTCSVDPMCGWCGGSNGTCTEGGPKSPVLQTCQANQWQYEKCQKPNGQIIEKRVGGAE